MIRGLLGVSGLKAQQDRSPGQSGVERNDTLGSVDRSIHQRLEEAKELPPILLRLQRVMEKRF